MPFVNFVLFVVKSLSARRWDKSGSLLIPEIRASTIAVGYCPRKHRPRDPERPIIPPYTPSMLRRVKFRHLIENLGVVLQRHKSVGKTLGDVKHLVIIRAKDQAEMFFECSRIPPKVDDGIINRTPGAAD